MSNVRIKETAFGFIYGAAEVTRLHSSDKGWVVMEVKTPKDKLQIYVTKTGKVRVFDGQGERKPASKTTKGGKRCLS